MLSKLIAYFRASGAVARLYVASLLFLTFVAFSNSVMGGEELIALAGLGLLLVFASAVWLIHLLLWGLRFRRISPVTISHPWRYWTFGPLMTLMAFLIIWTEAFYWIRFVASEPFLRRVAIEQLADNWTTDYKKTDKLAGLHFIRSTYRPDDGCLKMITTGHGGIADGGGFVYSSKGTRPPQGRAGPDDYTHLFGPWWRWRADF